MLFQRPTSIPLCIAAVDLFSSVSVLVEAASAMIDV